MLSIRKWQCPTCQAMYIRDENAAINGLGRVLWDLQMYPSHEDHPHLSKIVQRVRKILNHINEPSDPPAITPAPRPMLSK